MIGVKGCPTPNISSRELRKLGSPFPDPKLYRSTVGVLQYAVITRPDINFVVNKLSQYMAEPLDTHWRAVKRVLRTKHIELDLHFVRDNVLEKELKLRHVPSTNQIADILSKPLISQSYVRLRSKLWVVDLSSLGLREGERGIDSEANSTKMTNMQCHMSTKIELGFADVEDRAMSLDTANVALSHVNRNVAETSKNQDSSYVNKKKTSVHRDDNK